MRPELAFCTTEELINELMQRHTFLGVIVHSEEEFKRNEWGDERFFRVRFNRNLDADRASNLLTAVAEYMS